MYFRELQRLRGVAAGFVVLDHSISTLWPSAHHFAWALGDVGVGVFFVLSGFIMVHASEREFGAPGAARRFAIRRLQRVAPLYWFATLLMCAGLLADGEAAPVAQLVSWTLKSVLFVPYVNSDGLMRPLHDVGWTLNYEILFYAIFAVCLSLGSRLRTVAATTTAIVGLTLLGAFYTGSGWGREAYDVLSFLTYPIVLLFVAGMILAVAQPRLSALRAPRQWSLVATALMLLTALGFLLGWQIYPVDIGWRFLVWTVCILCVAGAVTVSDQKPARGTDPLAALGDASFSTYLFHPFALAVLARLHPEDLMGRPAALLLYLCAAHALGLLFHWALERPLLRIFKRWNGGRALAPNEALAAKPSRAAETA